MWRSNYPGRGELRSPNLPFQGLAALVNCAILKVFWVHSFHHSSHLVCFKVNRLTKFYILLKEFIKLLASERHFWLHGHKFWLTQIFELPEFEIFHVWIADITKYKSLWFIVFDRVLNSIAWIIIVINTSENAPLVTKTISLGFWVCFVRNAVVRKTFDVVLFCP